MFANYDARGNISNLQRNGFLGSNDPTEAAYGLIDDLTYNYDMDDNVLTSVGDEANPAKGFKGASSAYLYEFGNLVSDSQKGITDIDYTFFDLPTKITMSTNLGIEYTYDANGRKLRQRTEGDASTGIEDIIYMDGIQLWSN